MLLQISTEFASSCSGSRKDTMHKRTPYTSSLVYTTRRGLDLSMIPSLTQFATFSRLFRCPNSMRDSLPLVLSGPNAAFDVPRKRLPSSDRASPEFSRLSLSTPIALAIHSLMARFIGKHLQGGPGERVLENNPALLLRPQKNKSTLLGFKPNFPLYTHFEFCDTLYPKSLFCNYSPCL